MKKLQWISLAAVFALAGCQTTSGNVVEGTENNLLPACDVFMVLEGQECARATPEALAEFPLGSAQNPVRANGPSGQREYLSRLICPNGEHALSYARQGNVGEGPYGTFVDVYHVQCGDADGETTISVHIDMYHQHRETYPAAGFIDILL